MRSLTSFWSPLRLIYWLTTFLLTRLLPFLVSYSNVIDTYNSSSHRSKSLLAHGVQFFGNLFWIVRIGLDILRGLSDGKFGRELHIGYVLLLLLFLVLLQKLKLLCVLELLLLNLLLQKDLLSFLLLSS